MVKKMATLSSGTPIHGPVGDTVTEDSFVSTVQAASKLTLDMDSVYQNKIVDYCREWERVVTTRVEAGIKETKKLHKELMHYLKKVENLRRKVNRKEEAGKSVSKTLKEKLSTNEMKLQSAWKSHERTASMLCNLMEQVTKRGWKDLAPLVLNYIQFEVDHVSGTFVAFSRLPAISETLIETVGKASVPYENEDNTVVVALVDNESETAENTDDDSGQSVSSI